MKRIKQSQS